MKKLLTTGTFILAVTFLYSQGAKPSFEGLISGKVVTDSTNVPIDYASFKLFSAKDSTIKMGVFTGEDGKFSLEQVPYGNYYGRFSYAGYEMLQVNDIKISPTLKVANLGTVRLKPLSEMKTLKEIKVVGQLDVMKSGIDKKIYNVGSDISVKGGSANDVLNNIPSVEVNQDGEISLRGDGKVTVLIDGRPSSLSGGNGKSLLDALPSGSIERIEIVTNPSAKYDPDGTSGIINIVLKKNKLRGFNGLITGNVGSGNIRTGNMFDGSLSLSYRNAKVNVFGSYSGRYTEGYRDNYSNSIRTNLAGDTNQLLQDRAGTDLNFGHTFRAGAEFYLKPRNVLAISGTGSIGERNRMGDQWNSSFSGVNAPVALWRRTSDDPSQQQNLDFNVNYKYDLKNDRGNLIADVGQSFGTDDIQGYYWQKNYSLSGIQSPSQALQQRLFNKEKNNVTTAQLDFTYLLPKRKARIETGAKTILRNQGVNTYSDGFDTLQNAYVQNNLSNFNYTYDEQIFSLYGIFGQQVKRFKYQVGARVEKAYQIPNLVSQNIRIVNDYFNFFPSAHVRYALTEKSEVSLSYSRRITRATSSDLNPFTSYADPYNLRAGNPYLQPEFINSYDLGYMNEKRKFTYSASVFFRQTSNMITRLRQFDPVSNASTMTMGNVNGSKSYGAEVVVVYKPFDWWRNTISANANYAEYDFGFPTTYNTSGFNWNAKLAATFDFWKKTATIQINATYNGPRVALQGIVQRRGPVDISFDKSFKNGKWSLGCRVTDIFNRQGFYMTVDQPGIWQDSSFKWLTRRFIVTFSYKFGKLEISNKHKNGGDGGGYDM